jgi:hypothetical protein
MNATKNKKLALSRETIRQLDITDTKKLAAAALHFT